TYYYDAFGNIEEEKYYDANGNLTTTPINNNIRYAGYQYDEETELYYLTARMYDPKIARFLQEDTYTGSPDDPLSLNLYVYCGNNPLVYYDPTGHFRIFGVEFGNPIEGFKELFLTTEEEREQNFRIIYLYGGDDAYTTFVTDMGAALVEVGDLFKDPISQMNENNAILDSFLSNDLGLKDSKVYNTAKEALESDIKKVEAAAIYSINMFKSVAQTGYVIIDSNNKQMNFAYDTLGLLTGGSNFESWGNSAQDYYNHQRMLVSIPGNIVTGAVNDVRTLLNPKNAGNYFFNPDASLESIVEYQSAGFDTAMWVIPTAKVAPKIKTRITSTLGSISEKGIKGFVSDIKNGIKLKVGKKGASKALGDLSQASKYGIDTYGNLTKSLKGTGLQAHHIIEQRLADVLGISNTKSMLSVAVTKTEHQAFTNAWRKLIPYGTNYSTLTKTQIWNYAQEVYKDYPALLDAAKKTIFK
ncbi:RHS repeat-associated core domain-containing protein, partial [Acetivibrio mesophilus]